MSPHLVTTAADEAYRPPESRLGDATRATRPALPHSRRATCLPAIAGAYAAPKAGIGT